MDFSKLAKQAGDLLKTEAGKQISEKVAKTVKEKSGFDMSSALSLATANADIVDMLGNIGLLKKKEEPESTATQKLVSKLKTLVTKNVTKVDDSTFKTIILKLLSSSSVKEQIEKIAGSGTISFITKAIKFFGA